jgi:CheY-like chemotaxis protein
VRVLAESERRLSHAVDEAVRASRAKDDFLATLSHELRTPLNPVLLIASEAARDPQLSPPVRESFAVIRKNVELEARLIDDLLDLTAIVRDKLVIRKEVRNLHTILADAVAAVQPEFEAKDIALHVDLGEGKPLVYVDEVRMAQVFINLLKNAAKFTPAKGHVSLQVRPHTPGTITVRLTDSGIGMTAGELTRVFDAFEQGEHAADGSVHRFGGLGLGLAICQRLVDLHGGEITATSAGRDQGASFWVRLPLYVGAPPDLPGGQPASSSPGTVAPASAIRILLVEDHEATRKTLEQLLTGRGFRVTTAATLAQARGQAARNEFDLLVSDIGLPDGDGAVLMAELRTQHGLRGIALTGYGMDEDIARCRAAGFGAHLTKPIRIEALDAILREILDDDAHRP